MVKYQQYPEYKDSGVEWLENIPKEWSIEKFKYLFNLSREKNGLSPVGKMLSVSGYRGIEVKEYDHETQKRTNKELEDYRVVRHNQLVVNTMWLNYAGLGVSNFVGHVSPAYRCYCINKSLFSRYVHYLMRSQVYVSGYTKYMQGIRPNSLQIKTDDFNLFPILVPPSDHQKIIANFLDHETAKIDALIEKQQQLIELLKEKRQAVISHAVTKGLNPNIAMRDSGIEWLGEVPKHWQILKFNHCASIRNGQVDPTIKPYSLMILYAPNHIEKGTGKILFKENAKTQGADSGKYLCRKGEIIYSKIRPSLAKVALCEEEKALCSADMYPIKASNFILNKYLFFYLLSSSFTARTILDSDRVAMPKINRETLGDYKVPVPPIEEQKEIVSEIKNKSFRIDILIKKTNQMIELIQERRTALISAAVTGKIDVRNWQPPQPNHGESTHE